ncbi:hypothetical protein Y032_0016g3122 [Ancylostoma ceylanicum]|uniref:Uncharacterized protein n=1 Tax=Ancylostoma ceylanicum TaxID=53326 RepID=A0A016V630_9BILA|nr:hypothetical protein Y032_0016g3122 [Ancylostoma ceylanicum]
MQRNSYSNRTPATGSQKCLLCENRFAKVLYLGIVILSVSSGDYAIFDSGEIKIKDDPLIVPSYKITVNKYSIGMAYLLPSNKPCISDESCSIFPGTRCLHKYCATPGSPCTRDEDCPGKFHSYCVHSQCISFGQKCTENEECPFYPTIYCLNSICIKPKQCDTNTDCIGYDGAECIGFKCVKPTRSCRLHSDCFFKPHTYCIEYRCRWIYQSCTVDQDCPYPGYTRCSNSRCVIITETPPEPGSCESSKDCPSGNVCLNSKCVKRGACTSDADCRQYPEPYCIANQCQRLGQCRVDSDCPLDPLIYCLGYKCVKLGQACQADADCSYPQRAAGDVFFNITNINIGE